MMQPTERYRVQRAGSSAPLAILAIILAGVLFAGACGQQDTQSGAESQQDATTSGTNLLPQEALVGLDVVQKYFPEIEQQTATSENSTASGSPDATRMVIYEGGDGSRVTVSVDRYPSADAASTAFEQAIDNSEAVQGFVPLPAPADVGDKAFAGSVTQGADTHIGYGALAGEYVIGVTSAGYPATTENVEKLAGLTRDAVEKATA
ncbi:MULTISPECIES: hypothetical protein [Rhodococcus]|uniref:Lipoprotein n=2 Tax=Rhodococcus TaxID=1827 RepID=X0Q069_RHOWR|nr:MULTISPECIES: hypothetical protein [Rhodococcus]AII08197.1 hypothetical protein EP51_27675 [Rhodococcus opacus]WAM12407.1 hypothetical protein OYT95_23465 [Rhodococcus sp. JS3073]GAF44197.1 hypothetical protein RW1_012_00150 [Rhodococcus wratislaviensis NBRC 100605]